MPVITVEKPEHIKGTLQARLDWAEVTGKELTLKPPVFHHQDGHSYCNIIGGIAYPAAVDHIIRPGMVIIIGIEPDPVKFRVLETVESPSVFDLFTACIDLRIKYGYGEDRRILPNFMGDQEKYLAILLKVSEKASVFYFQGVPDRVDVMIILVFGNRETVAVLVLLPLPCVQFIHQHLQLFIYNDFMLLKPLDRV
jgi:hypothetical protein